MAVYSTGMTVSWNSQTFQELVSLDINWSGSRQDRGSANSPGWVPEGAKVTLTSLDFPIGLSSYGKLGTLTISGGGLNYNGPATMDGLSATPELNGVTRYTVTLSTID